MKLMKKLVAVVAVLTLTVGLASTAMAATWKTYFGLNKGWYEGTKGSLTSNSATGWSAKIQSIGWGGCWGGQVYQKLSIKKGKKYTVKFTIKSSKLDKYVYLKFGDEAGKKMNLGKWLDCKKGASVSVNETFTAKYDGDSVYFGIGGDFGDRKGVKTDKDANVRYKYAPNKKLDGRLGSDAAADHPTVITVSGFSFGEASTGGSTNTSNNTVNSNVNTNNGTVNTVTTTDTTVATGDFTPFACGATAILAAAAIVVFAKRRQED